MQANLMGLTRRLGVLALLGLPVVVALAGMANFLVG